MKPQNNNENFNMCICIRCPLYTDCNKDKGERLFCARTISGCAMDSKQMCFCPMGCRVYEQNKLAGAYFCIKELKD